MTLLDRFVAVIRRAAEQDNTSFLASVAVEHAAFLVCWSLVIVVPDNARNLWAFQWAAASILRKLNLLPGTVGDTLMLFSAPLNTPARRFLAVAGDALRALAEADPYSAWTAACAGCGDCSIVGLPTMEQSYLKYLEAIK